MKGFNIRFAWSLFALTLGLAIFASCSDRGRATSTGSQGGKKKQSSYRFVMISKVVHPWFDEVEKGALEAAKNLEKQTGDTFEIEYRAPENADVVLQNEIIEQTIATNPDGIFIDLLDPDGNRVLLEEAISRGIHVVIFDSVSPPGMDLTEVNNDFAKQSEYAAEKLVEMIGGKGKVAIMQGVPTAPNHRIRAEAHRAVFDRYPEIIVVAEGIDNDSIEQAQDQAAAIMAGHPDLGGFVTCDAAGPIGIGAAIREAGMAGKILLSGSDFLPPMRQLMEEGIMQFSACTQPLMQGQYAVIALWQSSIGRPVPRVIDTGIGLLTPELAADPNFVGF